MNFKQLRQQVAEEIYNITPQTFDQVALKVFKFQVEYNTIYRDFATYLNISPNTVRQLEEIPFLPIRLFKSKTLKTGKWMAETEFFSSGTTGSTPSVHPIRSLDWYQKLSLRAFERAYGPISQFAILALLPNYLERQGSSLVYMVDHFVQASGQPQSGFFLQDFQALQARIEECRQSGRRLLLWGVTFALLDFAEQFPQELPPDSIVLETGGMKGRRKEIVREEVHQQLQQAFGLAAIHSEYGMTELLSQAYSPGKGLFWPSASMRLLVRDSTDPFCYLEHGRSGGLNIIDLANLDSCAFIATDDLGKSYANGSFEVLGRFDASDVRGCNLMTLEI